MSTRATCSRRLTHGPYQVALDQAKANLAQAKGNLAKDQAALRDAQVNYQRDQDLFKDQIIAKQQLDTQLATADSFVAPLKPTRRDCI